MSDTTYKPQESVADFRERIARMVRERETGKKYIMVGASRPSPCLLRPTAAPEFNLMRSDIECCGD